MPEWCLRAAAIPFAWHRHTLGVFAVAITLLGVQPAANAQCAPRFPLRSPEASDFAFAIVDSLIRAKEGNMRWATRSQGNDAQTILMMKLAIEDYRCAAQGLAPFTRSRSEPIASGAEMVAGVYMRVIEADEQGVRVPSAGLVRHYLGTGGIPGARK